MGTKLDKKSPLNKMLFTEDPRYIDWYMSFRNRYNEPNAKMENDHWPTDQYAGIKIGFDFGPRGKKSGLNRAIQSKRQSAGGRRQ